MEILSLRELKKLISLIGRSNHKIVPVPLDPGPGWSPDQLKITSDYGRIVIPLAEDIVAILDSAMTFNPFDNLDQGSKAVGKDYAVYLCMDNRDSTPEIVVSESFDAPQTSHQYCRMIGYFHNGPDVNQAEGIILPFSVFSDHAGKYKTMVAVGDYSAQNNNLAPFKIDIYRAASAGESVTMLTGSNVQHVVNKTRPIYNQAVYEMRYFDALLSLGIDGRTLPSNMQWTLASLGVSATASTAGTTNGQVPQNRSFWGLYDLKTDSWDNAEQVAEWVTERFTSGENPNNHKTHWWQDGDEGVPSGLDSTNGAEVMNVKGTSWNNPVGDTARDYTPSVLLRGMGQLQAVNAMLTAGLTAPFRGVRA